MRLEDEDLEDGRLGVPDLLGFLERSGLGDGLRLLHDWLEPALDGLDREGELTQEVVANGGLGL